MLSRLLPRRRSRSDRERDASADVVTVLELDRWQLTGLLAFVMVIAVIAFMAGRASKRAEEHVAAAVDPDAAALRDSALPPDADARERRLALAEVWPPTSGIDDNLARPIAPPLPTDPTERARAQAHLQLQQARSIGLRDAVAAPALPSGVMAVSAQQPDPSAAGGAGGVGGGFTLQISLFDTQAAAQVIAQQLDGAGAAVRIRQVRTTDARQLFRVEVGDFPSSESALAFQRRFERDTGYSGVLIAL